MVSVRVRLLLVLCLAACTAKDPILPSFPEPDPEPQVQAYVGSQACGACHGPYLPASVHATYFEDWAASAHGRTADMTPSAATVLMDEDFREGLPLATLPAWAAWAPGGLAPTLGFDGSHRMQLGGRDYVIEKVVGIGRHLQAYLTLLENALYVLPAACDVKAGTWRPYLPEGWYLWDDANGNGLIDGAEAITGLVYAEPDDTPVSQGRTADAWDRRCAGCHQTGLSAVLRTGSGEFVADTAEDGVGCEACHGPGGLHAASLGGRGLDNRGIVNPGDLSAARLRDLCMSCHTRGLSVGDVGGLHLDFPWRADDAPFLPGQALSQAFTFGDRPGEAVHPLQGGHRHVGQDCQACHTAHDTTNLALVRTTIDTPLSGPRDVVFTARSGPPGSGGLLGDATDGTFTDVCEVCHTHTDHFRNDASAPSTDHWNGALCTACHRHERGFVVEESGGGVDCDACHDDLVGAMRTATPETRHLLDDVEAVYPTDPGVLRCLSCHVDHDLFSPEDRALNLRTDIAVSPATTGLAANTDFLAEGSGGICLSCHTSAQAKSYVRPDGSATTPPVPFDGTVAAQVAAYASGVHGGSYAVASHFGSGGIATFLANCVKCHNDDRDPKSDAGGQGGSPAFGLHASAHARLLAPLGYGGLADPLEEVFCFRCHAHVDDPVGGAGKPEAGRDWYDAMPMTPRAEGIRAAFDQAHVHPFSATRGRHATIEGAAPEWNPADDRHVECADCHNPHATGGPRGFDTSGLFAQPDAPGNLAASTPLQSVWGVEVPDWPAAWTAPEPASDYARVETSTHTWQVCLKCHSGYAYGDTPPAGQTDQAREFNPNNASYHAVIGASLTTAPPNSSFVSPWTKTSAMGCSDCHTTGDKNGSQGPHGSAWPGLLAGPFDDTTGQAGTAGHLCFKCHSFEVYGRGGSGGPSATGFSGEKGNLHSYHVHREHFSENRNVTCIDCHAAVPHGWHRRALLVVSSDPAPYNAGSAALGAADVAGWPAPGNWTENSCATTPCHDD